MQEGCRSDANATRAAVQAPARPRSLVLSGLTLPCGYPARRWRRGVPFVPATVTTGVVTTSGLSVQTKRPAQALTTQRSLEGCLFMPHLLWPELRADGGEARNLKTRDTRRGAGHVEHSACRTAQPRHVSLAA